MPRQTSSAGGQIDNRDSFNMKNNHISDSFNDYSETHCKYEFMQHPNLFLKSVQMLDVRLLPINSVESGLKVSPVEAVQSNTEFFGEVPFGMHLNDSLRPHIQRIRRTFSKVPRQTRSLSEENVMPGNSDEESDGANSSRMADVDSNPSPTSIETTRSRNPSPDLTSSSTKSDSEKPNPQVDHPMGNSTTSNSGSYNNAYPHHSSSNQSFPPRASASSSGPIFRTIDGDFIRLDTSRRQTNISSFNAEHNTIKNSFNNNSFDSSGKCWCHFCF